MLDRDHDDPETVIQHLHALTDPSVTANYDPQVIQTRALALFGQLKAHNRAANAQTRSHKQATADARMQMDHAHLALQNLLFEKRHLEREIEKCRQFAALGPVGRNPDLNRVDCEYATPIAPSPESVLLPLLELGAGTRFPQSISFFRRIISELMIVNPDSSIHQDVPLYSMELFTILAPDEFKTEEILNDPHQLIINRLNFEFSERQRLEKQRKELQQRKDESIKETKAKVTAIDNVRQQLDIFLKAATEAQKKVDDLIQPLQPGASAGSQGSQF